MYRQRLAALACFAAGIGYPAHAQLLPPEDTLVQFHRYTAVRERIIPGYSPTDIVVGDFTLSPSIGVSTEYNDNIFALKTPRVGDEYVNIAPSASLQLQEDTSSVSLNAVGHIDRYFNHSSENTEEVDTSLYGAKQIGSGTRFRLIARYHQDRESRESEDAYALTKRPIRYETATAALGLSQRFSSFLLSGEAGIARSHYFNAALFDGTPLDQQFRNNDLKTVKLRAEVAQSPSLAYFAQATQQWVSYRGINAQNGARNLELLGGVRFELPVRARGELGVGYVHANFDALSRSFAGVAIRSKVTFFPTELLTVIVNAERSVNDAGTPISSGYVALSGGIQADYELLRSLILSANLQLERDSFNASDRRDGRVAGTTSIEYRFSRGWALRGSYDILDLSSSGTARYKSFTRNRALVGLRFYL